MLFLMEFLHAEQGDQIAGVEGQHVAEGTAGAIDETRLLIVEPQASHGMDALAAREIGASEQRLMGLDGALDLAILAHEVAEDLHDFDRRGILLADLRELAQGQVGLAAGEIEEALLVMRRAPDGAIDER
ncbi:MAG: hypothetical protein MUF51_09605 [Vicinamibacteria bacterium]|nr:hypothetical protein [Vicinamibacteria bacterium]